MTLDEFKNATSLSQAQATRWYTVIEAALQEFDINSSTRIAAFLAQTGHETLGFTLTHELWGPTPEQTRYEPPSPKATELGNTKLGDGSRFRGRGLIQITGRGNYAECGKAFGVDFTLNPALLEQDQWAARSGAWWWNKHGCNALADSGDFVALTRRINGGTNGLADRQRRWTIAKVALNA